MKKLIFMLGILVSLQCSAQNYVKWSFTAKKVATDTYELHLKAIVQQPWHIYSQYMEEGGPIPTKITFADNPLVLLTGKTQEIGKPVSMHVEVFNMDVKYYENNVDYVQIVKVKPGMEISLSGSISFMLCEKDHCMPPTDMPFTIKLP